MGTLGTIKRDLRPYEVSGESFKNFSMCVRESSSLSSPSSLNGLQAIENNQDKVGRSGKIILPRELVILPILPYQNSRQSTDGGNAADHHNIL
jgi:hypothetical protein